MILVACKIKHPQSNKTVEGIFDADTGIAYVSSGVDTIVMAPGGVSFVAAHTLAEWFELLSAAAGDDDDNPD